MPEAALEWPKASRNYTLTYLDPNFAVQNYESSFEIYNFEFCIFHFVSA